MNISKRLKLIASLIENGKNVIDIGCDHALLDIYLTKYNNNTCLAVDKNKNALSNAKQNIKKYNVNIETCLSDGLTNIIVKPNTTVVIAGMGTSTILEILNTSKINNIDELIIQTNNDYYLLRNELTKSFKIIDEIAIYDNKKWYIIIKFVKEKAKYSKMDLILGPILKNKNDNETINFYKYNLNKIDNILIKLPKKYVFKRINYINLKSKIKKIIMRKK